MSVPPRDWRGAPGIHYRGLKMSPLLPFKRAPEPRASFSCCCAAQYSFEEMLCSDKITADNVNPRLHFNFVLHFLWYVLILKIFRVPFFFLNDNKATIYTARRSHFTASPPTPSHFPQPKDASWRLGALQPRTASTQSRSRGEEKDPRKTLERQ